MILEHLNQEQNFCCELSHRSMVILGGDDRRPVRTYKIVGIDTGGTFVDFVAVNPEGRFEVFKIPSTPLEPSQAVVKGIDRLGGKINEVIHGTTVATNAVLERKGARVALVTTKGFKDVIEIGRQNRSDIYELVPSRPEPLVPRAYRIEVEERVLADASVEIPLDLREIERMELPEGTESIAVCFLFSFFNPRHELEVREVLEHRYPRLSISTSYEVLPEYREYERFSTTVMDAYVKPLMGRYLSNLVSSMEGRTELLAVMKSSGGLATPDGLLRKPVETLVSGLAGGILAAQMTAEVTGIGDIISVDIGGTSTDVAQISGGRVVTHRSMEIGGLPIGVESVDVKTIGAGGGSIARVKAGLLRVGPESAAGRPGPAAYDMGGQEATVTDANLAYGILGTNLAGGILTMSKERALEALQRVGEQLGTGIEETIVGIRRVFHENIAAALRNVSTDRGVDPRKHALVAFGGAGPLHAAELAELLGITTVIIPPFPGTWSAVGLLSADYRYDVSRGIVKELAEVRVGDVEEILDKLEAEARRQVEDDGIVGEVFLHMLMDVRFRGQSYEITVPWDSDLDLLKKSFLDRHREMYGFAAENEPMELVTARVVLEVPHKTPRMTEIKDEEPEPYTHRQVQGVGSVPVYTRDCIGLSTLQGPLVIDQLDTTTWVPQGWKAKQNSQGFLTLEVLK